MELAGRILYIPKINPKETKYRDELIRNLYYQKNKSIPQLAREFRLCPMRIRQIIKGGKKQ
jgi:Mor family transcriptional regulator